MLKTKLFVGAVALAVVLGVAVPASAQTTAELTAQINALLAQIAQLQAQIGGSTVAAGATFTQDLTVGSTGSEVTALQQWLVSKGYMVAPASYGYFGPLTQAALAKYQVAAGITPAAGYFGPITRAKVNATQTTTTTTTTTTSSGSITTTGDEGDVTVTVSNAGTESTAYEGDEEVAILGFKVKAVDSDMAVQRVKLDLGANTKIYRKIYEKLYVTVDGDVLAEKELDSSTVTKSGSRYYVTLADFSYVVSKDDEVKFVVKADVYGTVDSTDQASYTVRLADNGVRAVDGAGIDQYGGEYDTDYHAVTIDDQLSETATLKVSLDSGTPEKQNVVAVDGASDDEYDKLPVLSVDIKATKDDVEVTDFQVKIDETSNTSYADVSTAYLYDGSTEIASADVAGEYAVFNDIDYVIEQDETATLTVKVDVVDAEVTMEYITASASSTDITAENSDGDALTASYISGTATGYAIGVSKVGPVITLVSKIISTDGVPQSSAANEESTSTLTAIFNVKVEANGGDIILGTVASTTWPMFSKSDIGSGSPSSFKLYMNGTASSANVATSTAYTIPSTCAVGSLSAGCTLSDGSSVTVPVTFMIPGRTAAETAVTQGIYSVGLEAVSWLYGGVHYTTNFMAGDEDWRTSDVSFP